MPRLSLAHFTVIDADPLELIDVAAAAGFDAVGLRLIAPPGAAPVVPVVGNAALQDRIRSRLSATGQRILDTEAVWLVPDTDVAALVPFLDTSAELGAQQLIVCSNDPDRARARDNLGRLCDASNSRDLRVMFEFMPYTEVRSLAAASELLREVRPANAGILVDAVHLSRSGGTPADLALYDPSLFNLVHLCDVPLESPPFELLRAEARGGRLYPGEGGLWLEDFVSAFPADTVFAIEAPSIKHAHLEPIERAKLAGVSARALFDRVEQRIGAKR
jgi:sugar phosphate isomerase/epimerase